MNELQTEFVPYDLSLKMKALGFDEPCVYYVDKYNNSYIYNFQTHPDEFIEWCGVNVIPTPTFSQAINFLYICSNKQIDIELKASDTYEERLRKIDQGCEDLWNLQNSKSN